MRLFILVLWLLTSAAAQGRTDPVLDAGLLDLRLWNSAADGSIDLSGTWRVTQGLSKNPWVDWETAQQLTIPDYAVIDLPAGTVQNASYLLKVKIGPDTPVDLDFVIQHIVGAHRVRVCEDETGSCRDAGGSGVVSANPSEVRWHGAATRVQLGASVRSDGFLLLVIDSSSFLRTKGFTLAPVLGRRSVIDGEQKVRLFGQVLLLGAFGMIALHALCLFLQSRRSKADLYVALLALCFMARYFCTEWLEFLFIPAHNALYQLAFFSIFHSSVLALTCFALFLETLYGGPWQRWLSRTLLATSGTYIVSQWVFDASFFMSWINPVMALVHFALMIAITASVARIFLQKQKDSGLILISISVLLVTAINDYCAGILKTHGLYLFHYGVFVFSFAQSLITARRFERTHRQNEKLLVEISEKEQARTLFFHNTSHELRTPLNGLIGFLNLLRDQRFGRMTEQAREQLGKCLRLSESLKNQVNTILDLAKAKKGMLSLNASVLSLPEMVREARELAEGLLLRKSESRFEVQEDWDSAQPDFIGDKEKLATILRNLLGNAFKFADTRRPNHVQLRISKNSGSLQIQVKDSGIGIPADQQALIFEEFKQVAGDARRAYEGTGLGLSMVRDLVQLMGGTIAVQSTVDQGSLFTVTLPEQPRHLMAPLRSEVVPLPQAMAPIREMILAPLQVNKTLIHQGRARLLVVDDNEINCEVIQHMLEEKGYEVETVLSGRAALDVLKRRRFEVILLDMMMPEMSGEDVIRALRSDLDLRDIPIILITARASDSDRIFGLSLGADDYLAKPLNADELTFRVKNLLDRLDLQRKGQGLEEQERMAQLGELLSDMSHELKNVFQFSDAATRLDRDGLERIVRRLPVKDQAWQTAATSIVELRNLESAAVDIKSLSFPDDGLAQDPALRSLRLRLSYLAIAPADRQILWARLLALSPDDRLLCDQTLGLVRSFVLMRDQTRFAQEVIGQILNFNRLASNDSSCRLSDAVQSVRTLAAIKINKLKLNWIDELPDVRLAVNVVHLRQILLNVLTHAVRTVQALPVTDRWLRWEGQVRGRSFELRLTQSGEKIPEAIADRIFSRGFGEVESAGRSLGLLISRRLIQRAAGSIHLDQSGGSPCFVITLPLDQEMMQRTQVG